MSIAILMMIQLSNFSAMLSAHEITEIVLPKAVTAVFL